ncbi:hypothetical protein ACPF8X_02675 [Streptomyces sp. G35A]
MRGPGRVWWAAAAALPLVWCAIAPAAAGNGQRSPLAGPAMSTAQVPAGGTAGVAVSDRRTGPHTGLMASSARFGPASE